MKADEDSTWPIYGVWVVLPVDSIKALRRKEAESETTETEASSAESEAAQTDRG